MRWRRGSAKTKTLKNGRGSFTIAARDGIAAESLEADDRTMKAGDGNDRVSKLERRIQSLERSPARTNEELSKIQSSRRGRAAGAYWRLRAEVGLVLSYIIHPTAAFKLAAQRLLPIRLRLRLLKLVRHEPTLDARFAGEARELGGLPAPAGRGEACHATVLFLPAMPWSFRRQRPQHLAVHLAALDWPVAWVLDETAEKEEVVSGGDLAPGVRGIRLPHHEALNPLGGSLEEADAAALGEALVRWRRRHRIHETVVVCESPYWVRLAEWLKQYERWPLIYDLIDPAGSQEEFLQRPDPAVRRPDDEDSGKAGRAFAESTGWEELAAALAGEIKSCFPRVSIAIATFNNILLTKLCLESVRTRTVFPNYQVIVVDNGSTDGTQEYLEEKRPVGRSSASFSMTAIWGLPPPIIRHYGLPTEKSWSFSTTIPSSPGAGSAPWSVPWRAIRAGGSWAP